MKIIDKKPITRSLTALTFLLMAVIAWPTVVSAPAIAEILTRF